MLGYADELLAVSQTTGDEVAALWALRTRASANLLQGRFEEARRDMQAVIELYKDTGEDPRMARVPRVSTYTNLGICLTALGYPDAGAAASLDGVRHAESANHTVSLIAGLRRACVRGMMVRDREGVRAWSDRLLAVNAEHETFSGSHEGTIIHAWSQLQVRWDAALMERAQTSLEQLDTTKHRVMLPFFMASVAEIVGNHGDPRGASALLDRAHDLVRRTGEQWCEAEIMRLKARFAARGAGEAVALFEASLAKARQQAARLWELRTATALAELRFAREEHAAARELLAPIVAWFTEGGDMLDLVSARTLLAEFDQPSG
jgi:hypothetical protein